MLVKIEQVMNPSGMVGVQMAGQAFQITAWTLSGAPVTAFDPPFLLTITYASLPLGVDLPLSLYHWKESAGLWEKIPATHNPLNRTLTATLNHLTTFAAMQREKVYVYVPLVLGP